MMKKMILSIAFMNASLMLGSGFSTPPRAPQLPAGFENQKQRHADWKRNNKPTTTAVVAQAPGVNLVLSRKRLRASSK